MKYIALIFLVTVWGCSTPDYYQGEATQEFFRLDAELENVVSGHFFDGGTTALELTDIHGNKSLICIDNQSYTTLFPLAEKDLPETKEKLRKQMEKCIYMGVRHPSHEGAEKIEYRSQLESDILERIEVFIEQNPQFEDDLSNFIAVTQTERVLRIDYYEDLETYLKQ